MEHKETNMNGCPDDDMAARVIAQKLSNRQQAEFDDMARRGTIEYTLELEAGMAKLQEENRYLKLSLQRMMNKGDEENNVLETSRASSLNSQEQGLAGSERSLDALVAEQVMGWQRQPGYNYWMTFPEGGTFELHKLIANWHPSTSIADAMEVVEKMREQGWSFACTLYEAKLPYASFCKQTATSSRNAEASTLPEAICKAALAAVAHNAPAD